MSARTGLGFRIAQVAAIGLASGGGFILPMLAMLRLPQGTPRTIGLLLSLAVAMLLIRRLGRILHRLLDRMEQPVRFPLLTLYGVATMLPPVSLLLLPSIGR